VLFPTVRFALFYCCVLPASWLLMPRPFRWRLFMLAASFCFYAAWDWHYTLLLAASIVGNEIGAVGVHRASGSMRRRWTIGTVVANLLVLGWFKYVGFFAESANGALGWFGVDWSMPIPDVVLPVGISFFTFQALSYVIDVERRKITPVGLLDFAVYLSFFPHLVAGPIVRASEFLPQLRTRRDPRQVDAGLGLWLIAAGLFKKVVIATYLEAEIVAPLFDLPGRHGGIEALVGVYAYAIQIYADFSGYTDIAIGLALLLGFRFPQNFDAPYTSRSLQDFWRRWHMTLSRWLRDYLYVPLGGNRGARWHTYLNLVLTMVLGGLWHGAAWTFVIWGLLHGGGMAFERWRGERRDARRSNAATGDEPAPTAVVAHGGVAVQVPPAVAVARPSAASTWAARILTFNFVCLGWVFFRATSVENAFDVLGRIFRGRSSVPLNPMVVVVVGLMLASQFVPVATVARWRRRFSGWPVLAQAGALAAVLVLVDVLGPQGVAPFIYFQF
jgi:alginate O-acetyltransferase complex protein AlgI